jgi:hypothetical protein
MPNTTGWKPLLPPLRWVSYKVTKQEAADITI